MSKETGDRQEILDFANIVRSVRNIFCISVREKKES